jgi:hypothetical protein
LQYISSIYAQDPDASWHYAYPTSPQDASVSNSDHDFYWFATDMTSMTAVCRGAALHAMTPHMPEGDRLVDKRSRTAPASYGIQKRDNNIEWVVEKVSLPAFFHSLSGPVVS